MNVFRRSTIMARTYLKRANRLSFLVPTTIWPFKQRTSVHLRKASLSIKADASAIIALGSFANWIAVGIKCSFTNFASWNALYVSAYLINSSNELALTFAHELFSELTRKLKRDLDYSRPYFSSRFRGSKTLPLLTWCSSPPNNS